MGNKNCDYNQSLIDYIKKKKSRESLYITWFSNIG
jgi:hypothetical protein